MTQKTKAQNVRQKQCNYRSGRYTRYPKCEHCGKPVRVETDRFVSHEKCNEWGVGVTLHPACGEAVMALPEDQQRAACSRFL